MANWREVVSMVYQYIGLLRYHCREGLPKWIYEELRSIQEVSYRYDDEQAPEDFVESLADELAPTYALPPERLLDGTSLLFEYDPISIQVCTGQWNISSILSLNKTLKFYTCIVSCRQLLQPSER